MSRSILIAIFACNMVYAQQVEPGAEAASLGGAFVTKASPFSSRHNMASLTRLEQSAIAAGIRNNYLINDLNDFYLHAVFRLKSGILSTDFSYYGFNAYQQGEFGLGYALNITQNWSIGVRLSSAYNYLSAENKTRYLISADVGLQGTFERWRTGISISRFAQTQWLGDLNKAREPIIFRAGGGYFFSNSSAITAELYKATNSTIDLRLGLNYKPTKNLDLRLGFSTLNPSVGFGLGINFKQITINVAASWHQQLGLSPATDVQYAW